uniref:sterile alpha motif domain-containing protein 1-like isoform X1 n=1 Tax=Nyctereutes procyonoides TaxID=34880 RepID=UPI00244499EE|nr:sterile alpha motif domain-containing protein 1-like isoform X1 [Nyctereutes procyonoides]XP_055175981.1 sterile alpha motif domain-containing protein 1-like isoform X1 [Nyctereutes procyonoides]
MHNGGQAQPHPCLEVSPWKALAAVASAERTKPRSKRRSPGLARCPGARRTQPKPRRPRTVPGTPTSAPASRNWLQGGSQGCRLRGGRRGAASLPPSCHPQGAAPGPAWTPSAELPAEPPGQVPAQKPSLAPASWHPAATRWQLLRIPGPPGITACCPPSRDSRGSPRAPRRSPGGRQHQAQAPAGCRALSGRRRPRNLGRGRGPAHPLPGACGTRGAAAVLSFLPAPQARGPPVRRPHPCAHIPLCLLRPLAGRGS